MYALSAKSVASPVCSGRSVNKAVSLRAPVLRRRVAVRAEYSNTGGGEELNTKLQATAEKTSRAIKEQWETTPDAEKPAAIAIIVAVTVAQVAIAGTLDSVEHLPLIKQFLEFVGFAVSAVYAYRYFTDPAERESWKKSLDNFVANITGK